MTRAGAGTALFVLVGPAIELGLGPWVLTGFDRGDALPGGVLPVVGAVLLAGALAVLTLAFVRFAGEGDGTPSPLAPPRRPVRGGVYARVRHPMYAATVSGLVGEALLLRRPVLLVAAALYAITMAVLVRYVEEPLLRRRFGEGWRTGGAGG